MRSARWMKVMVPFARTMPSANRTQSPSAASPSIVAAAFAGSAARLPRPRPIKGGVRHEGIEAAGAQSRRRLQQIADHGREPVGHAVEQNIVAGEPHEIALELRRSRSEEHTSELQSHSFISYAVFCLK